MQDTASSPKKPATYADIEALPPNMVGEILHGSLHSHPRPAPAHLRAAGRLFNNLETAFDQGIGGPGGWTILHEPELHLDDHVIVPDIAGWRLETMPDLPEKAYFEVPPDWVSEILSPSTMRIDRADKLQIYAQYGVGHAWYANPLAYTLEGMKLVEGHYQITSIFKDLETVTAPPFEPHAFDLSLLWRGDIPQEHKP